MPCLGVGDGDGLLQKRKGTPIGLAVLGLRLRSDLGLFDESREEGDGLGVKVVHRREPIHSVDGLLVHFHFPGSGENGGTGEERIALPLVGFDGLGGHFLGLGLLLLILGVGDELGVVGDGREDGVERKFRQDALEDGREVVALLDGPVGTPGLLDALLRLGRG